MDKQQTGLSTQSTQNSLMPKTSAHMQTPQTISPPVDIYEDENGITLLADMPGVRKDTLNLNVEGEVLTIEGEIALKVPENASPILTEMNSRRYARSFTLGRELSTERVQAEVKNGVLRLFIPRSESYKPKKIDVHVAS